jgi:hypothetical protein
VRKSIDFNTTLAYRDGSQREQRNPEWNNEQPDAPAKIHPKLELRKDRQQHRTISPKKVKEIGEGHIFFRRNHQTEIKAHLEN